MERKIGDKELKNDSRKNAGRSQHSGVNIGLLVLTLFVLCYGVYVIGDKAMTLSHLNNDIDQARVRLEEAQNENQQLKAENASLSDDAYIEKLAREELGMTRQGEIPYIYAENK